MDRINRDGAKKHAEMGKELLEPGSKQDLEGAISEYTKAIFLVDDEHEYFSQRGRAYVLLKDYKTAISNFKRALTLRHSTELSRKTANLMDAEGLSRLQNKDFAEAIHNFSAALDADPSCIYCYVHRALAFMGQGKFEEALKGLGVYLEKEQKQKAKLLIHLLVAKINKQMKNPTTAAVHVNAALKIEPDNEEALRLYVELKGRAGELFAEATEFLLKNQPMQAIDSLKHAIELDDKDTRFLVRRGVIFRQMGNYNEAVADLEKVLELTNGNSSDASRQLAITYNQLGIELYSAREYQKALDVFQLAIKNDDKSASIFINRGDCHREMHQVGLALQDYLHAHELNPDDTEVRIRLSTLYDARGLTFFDRGMLDEAFREFSNAIQYLPQVSHYYIHRATAAMELGNLDAALGDYRTVVKMDPYNEQAWAKLSSLGDNQGKRWEAGELESVSGLSAKGKARSKTTAPRSRSVERTMRGTRGRTLGTRGGLGASNASTDSVGRGDKRASVTRVPVKSRSPTRTSKLELEFLVSMAQQKDHGMQAFRKQLAYKTGLRLDTTCIDEKYSNIVSGLPSMSVKGVDPYPLPVMK